MKKKDIDAVYEENPAEDATAEEKASGKKKKSKKKKIKTEQASESRKEQNKVFAKASYFFVLMFLSLCAYLVYFNIADRETINSSSYNTKQDNKDTMVIRGSIYSSDGELLAVTNVAEDGSESRSYPYGRLFSHVVGYASNGRSGTEATYNTELTSCHASLFEQIKNEAQDVKIQGDSVNLSLDTLLQRAAYDALGNYSGAVVVLEPSTGRVLAMVSKPDFDPASISEDWETLNSENSGSPLLNRAVQGLYPPGSTFKILTTLAYMRQHPGDYQNFTFNCEGLVSKDDVNITCYAGSVHGLEDLETAFKNSCNGAFATIGMELDNSEFKKICESFGFNKDLSIHMASAASRFTLAEDASYGEEMTTAIGQGDTLATPLQMAMVAAAVANGGTLMKPYYVDSISTYDGDEVKTFKSSSYASVMSAAEAETIGNYMITTVKSGTASALSGASYTAAGKTGSAEYDTASGERGTHSWFVGYSNVDHPDLAIAVIAEDGGSGSAAAVPIAKYVFDTYYQNKYGY